MNLRLLTDQRTIAPAERELRRLLSRFVAFHLAIYSVHIGLHENIARLIALLWPVYLLRLHGSVEDGHRGGLWVLFRLKPSGRVRFGSRAPRQAFDRYTPSCLEPDSGSSRA